MHKLCIAQQGQSIPTILCLLCTLVAATRRFPAFAAAVALWFLAAAAVLLVVEPEESKEGKHQEADVEEFVKDYEGEGMVGPNNVCCGPDGSLFFTDSGPLGETTFKTPMDLVFASVKVTGNRF